MFIPSHEPIVSGQRQPSTTPVHPGECCLDRRRLLLATMTSPILLLPSVGSATPLNLPDPGPRTTCPVCGMFVARYPAWIGTVLFADGYADHFDGAKDLFKYLFDLERYAPGRSADSIVGIGVTEYYDLRRIDAYTAWYVIGSQVLGPMGHELLPLETEADAQEFLEDHQGHAILRFQDVTPALLSNLDAGRFDF